MLAAVSLGMLLYAASVLAQEKTDAIVITADEIKRMNVQKISDVLNQVPGIKAGDSFVSIRGSYKVKVLLDGRPINDPTSSHGLVKFDLVPPENVERIEIYRGKGALKYGDDASGGVILILTRKIDIFNGNMKSYWGNLDTYSHRANCRANRGAFGMSASAGYDYTGGYQVNGDRKKRRAGGKIEYRPDKDLNLALSIDYLKDERGLSGRLEYPTLHSRKEGEMFSYALSMGVKGIVSETFLNDAKTRNRDPDRDIDNFITVKRFGEDLSTSLSPGKWGTLNCGAAFRWQGAEGSRFASSDERSVSIFAADALSFKRVPVTVSIGLRGTVYSEFDNTLNPETNISYKKDKWTLSFSYSQTSNTPSFYQRYDKTSTKEPNPGLGMETTDSFNLSFFSEISPCLSCGASLFCNRISDRITYVLGDNGIGRYENFGKVIYRGGDILLNVKIMDTLSLKTTYTYLEATDKDTGFWMVARPRHRMYADLFYRPMAGLSIIANLKYDSKQYTRSDNKASVPGRIIENLRVEHTPAWTTGRFGRVEFFGEVKNIANKTYCYGDGWLAPPRTWIGGLNYRF
ncbi:MAG: TonB-dependent receptor plug domain-containing protein [Deltaproteobacteria bacterium]|nr:TonB-dependent receptor plug domain-containing protein [Deltaproteobacteria bacterium]